MRRLGFYLTLTVDGLYADPDGGLGHYEPAEDEHAYANGIFREAGGVVMGRVMYEAFAEYWDAVDLTDPAVAIVERDFTTYWRAQPKHVVSRGSPTLGPNASVLDGDVTEALRRLKADPGPDLLLVCGAELLATLIAADLVDDYRLLVTPMALGDGTRLFASLDAPVSLRLIGTRTFASGSVLLEYESASVDSVGGHSDTSGDPR